MKKVSLVLTTLLMAFSLFAQNIAVRGTVTDASTGEPVAFASIAVKGTTSGTSSGLDGTYTLNAPANATLVFSFIGYKTQEIVVNGRTVVDCALAADAEYLEDVIVIGYGTTRREAKTGAVSTVKADEIAAVPASSVDKMLAGKMAGVTISSETGQPGSNSQIRIRGTSSINAGNEPLWVVDGIPVMSGDQSYFTNTNNAIAAINPNDIESLTVLKDAAAASIYGSRAANGVILVTTKSGKAGKASFSARAKFGVSTLANDTPPDYWQELDKCLYYFERIKARGNYSSFGCGVAASATIASILVPMHPKRNNSYTIATSGSFGVIGGTVTSMAKDNSSSNYALNLAVTGTFTSGAAALLRSQNDANAYIDVNNDLQ